MNCSPCPILNIQMTGFRLKFESNDQYFNIDIESNQRVYTHQRTRNHFKSNYTMEILLINHKCISIIRMTEKRKFPHNYAFV